MTLQELSVEYRAHAETLSARVKELERRLAGFPVEAVIKVASY